MSKYDQIIDLIETKLEDNGLTDVKVEESRILIVNEYYPCVKVSWEDGLSLRKMRETLGADIVHGYGGCVELERTLSEPVERDIRKRLTKIEGELPTWKAYVLELEVKEYNRTTDLPPVDRECYRLVAEYGLKNHETGINDILAQYKNEINL